MIILLPHTAINAEGTWGRRDRIWIESCLYILSLDMRVEQLSSSLLSELCSAKDGHWESGVVDIDTEIDVDADFIGGTWAIVVWDDRREAAKCSEMKTSL